MGNKRLYDIMKEKDAIYMKEDFTDEDGIRASELEAEFADMDGWNAESDAATLLNGLGIPTEEHYTQMGDMPGPLKVKVLLAQALFGNPDILLLECMKEGYPCSMNSPKNPCLVHHEFCRLQNMLVQEMKQKSLAELFR